MILFIPLLFLEGTISFFVKVPTESIDIVSIIFIAVNTLMMMFVLARNLQDKALFFIIMTGYILRVFLVIVDVFVLRLPPHSGGDTELFHEGAVAVSQNLDRINDALGGMYTKFLGIFYYIFGPQRLMAQYLNTLLGILMVITMVSILRSLYVKDREIRIAVLIMTFFPQNMIFSSILLREALVGAFLLLSVKYFVLWFNKPKISYMVLSIALIFGGSVFHSAIVPALMVYIFIYSVYSPNNKKIMFTGKSLIILGVFSILLVLAYVKAGNILFGKFAGITSADSLMSTVSTNFGGSAYLTGVKLDNFVELLVFTPIKTVYFLFSPMLWSIRGIEDIVSILLDSSVYLYLIYYIFRYRNKCNMNNKVMVYSLLAAFLFDAVTLGLGTSTAGTAIRHRNKIFSLLVLVYIIVLNGYRNAKTEKVIGKEEGNNAEGEYHSTYI